jgi:hypothetical protein
LKLLHVSTAAIKIENCEKKWLNVHKLNSNKLRAVRLVMWVKSVALLYSFRCLVNLYKKDNYSGRTEWANDLKVCT